MAMSDNTKLAIGAGVGILALGGIAYALSAKATTSAGGGTVLTTGHSYSLSFTMTPPTGQTLGNQNVTQALVAAGFSLQGSPTISGNNVTATAIYNGTNGVALSGLPTADSMGDTISWTSATDQSAGIGVATSLVAGQQYTLVMNTALQQSALNSALTAAGWTNPSQPLAQTTPAAAPASTNITETATWGGANGAAPPTVSGVTFTSIS
jgi:hypothetical protein